MQIKIDMKILIFLLIFYINNQLKIYIALMIFACIHELGHLCVGKILGLKPYCFEVKPVGFSVSFINKVKDYNKKILKGNMLELKKILVYITGPLLNIIIAVIIYYTHIDNLSKQYLIYINLIIALFNLFPIYPLDGGRIVKSMMYIFFGLKKSYVIVEQISKIMVVALLVMGSFLVLEVHNWGIVIIIMYVVYIKIVESRMIKYRLRMYELIEK